jgi:hypothetical protein
MSSASVITGLWLGGLASQVLLVTALLARRNWNTFPVFTAYAIFTCVVTGLMYALRSHAQAYFWAYWICEAIGLVLGFGILYEIFQTLFAAHSGLRRFAQITFCCAVIGLFAIALLVFYRHSASETSALVRATWVLEEATRVIEVGLLLFLFLFSTAFGLHSRQKTFGIALGLGIFAAVELVGVAIRIKMGNAALPTFNMVRALAFDCSLLIWIGYILAPEPVTTGELPQREQLEQWNRAVMEFMHQ